MVDATFHDDVMAELAVLNTAVMQALHQVARQTGDPEVYKRALLDAGLRSFDPAVYGTVPPDRRAAFEANFEARWHDFVAGLSTLQD